MRIISGIYKGKVLSPPKNLPTRPTTDFAKTGLFNMLNNRLDYESTSVLDLCAGTGNITLEFASRGAKYITSVDQHAACVKYISDTAKELKFSNIKTWKIDLFRFIDKTEEKFDLIFADPPYDATWIEQIHEKIIEKNLLNGGGLLIIEHGSKTDLSALKYFEETRNYGNVNFSIFTFTI